MGLLSLKKILVTLADAEVGLVRRIPGLEISRGRQRITSGDATASSKNASGRAYAHLAS
jgi:hypothetical protein